MFCLKLVKAQVCMVTNTDGSQKPCVFPFLVTGRTESGVNVTYDTCTNILDPDDRFWCSTKVDRSGVHQAGNWGYCDRGAAKGDCPLPGPNTRSRADAITVPQLIKNRAQSAKNSEEECTGVRLPFHWEDNLDIDLIAATKDKNWSVMKCLLAKLNRNGGGALLWAALNGNPEGVKQLLDAGVDVNSKTAYDYTALMAAARNGHENIVKTLVEKGAKVDVKDNEGMSALILAAQYGRYEIVKFLIPRISNINEKASVVTSNKGKSTESGNAYTALHWATNGNYTTIVEELIANGADVNAITAFGTSALSIAATKGFNVVLNLLISYGANIDVQEKFSGITPLITAINYEGDSGNRASTRTDFENVVKTLIKKGADVNHVTKDGNTALYHAARFGFVPIVEDLIEAGAAATINQIKSANPAGNTPLLALRENIQKNSIGLEAAKEIEQILLENGALEDPTQQFRAQRT